MGSKRLTILRHAKSSWNDPGLADHDRPLNARGMRAATRIGQYLRDEDMRPDLVLCSSAERTRQTLALLNLAPTRVEVEDDLYGASAGELMARLWEVDSAESVLLIGHNPGVHELAISLVGDSEGIERFPTAALADLSVPIDVWDDLRPAIATIVRFVAPSDL